MCFYIQDTLTCLLRNLLAARVCASHIEMLLFFLAARVCASHIEMLLLLLAAGVGATLLAFTYNLYSHACYTNNKIGMVAMSMMPPATTRDAMTMPIHVHSSE